MTIEKAIDLINEYLSWSMVDGSVSPKQVEFEQALILVRDYVKDSVK